MQQPTVPTAPSFSQHRRWLKTSFRVGRKALDYALESKNEAALQKTIPWDQLSPSLSHITATEPDRELRWVMFVMAALGLFAALRGGPQPLTVLIYCAVTAFGSTTSTIPSRTVSMFLLTMRRC